MKTLTIEDIRALEPCYDPGKHLPEDWTGTALDILKLRNVPVRDKFWVVLREEFIDTKTLRLFAVWCMRQVQHLMKDERSLKALDVAERYAHGNATDEELSVAYVAAYVAASDAAYVAAYAADYAAYAADDHAAEREKQSKKLIEMLEG